MFCKFVRLDTDLHVLDCYNQSAKLVDRQPTSVFHITHTLSGDRKSAIYIVSLVNYFFSRAFVRLGLVCAEPPLTPAKNINITTFLVH